MKFQTAVNKLKKIANGKYCSVDYGQTFYPDGTRRAECSLYIDGGKMYNAPTWHEVFHLIESGVTKLDNIEAPECDDENQV